MKENRKEFASQQKYIDKLRKINDEYFEKTGMRKKHLTVTYGCQMNEHDSEKLAGMLDDMGYIETDQIKEADLIIYNTCCVRENAELKVYGNLGYLKHLKKENPDLIIAVCGCMMQQPHVVKEIKKKYRHVDLIFGTHNIHEFPQLLENCKQLDSILIEVWDKEGDIVEGLPAVRKFKIKAFVNVMYGCNNFCSYCIVPYTRGRERSREPEDIIMEIDKLVSNGTKEVMLLGQNVNSYGKTLKKPIDFAELLYNINKIESLERIRFMTSHPKDLSNSLIQAMRDCEKVCEHIHLPLQSGSTQILEKMNRYYSKEQYLELIQNLKNEIPNISITTDIIVGFPGETEENFKETLEVVKKVEFDSAFTFLYSIRKGTVAEKMKDQVPDNIKHKRFNQLVEILNEISYMKNIQLRDQILNVLVEGPSKNDEEKLMGRTRTNKLVNFSGNKNLIGKIMPVKITDTKTFSLSGTVIKNR
jgi:tRNA-2-methylthio-N6-dimethylallyladenosine synthase